ncbi:hypothetical protein WMW72_11290 [Paenibacillus filicis]|uniref:Uncharacterized protein n=1 Tax=Paenibacillus filicis TaxID=669464 RepID=A0ABU9DK76_9BACL
MISIWFVAVQRISDSSLFIYETEDEAKEEYENLFVKYLEDEAEDDVKLVFGKVTELTHFK